MSFIGNIIWLIFGGFIAALGYIIGGLALCVTIVGIPFALDLGDPTAPAVQADDVRPHGPRGGHAPIVALAGKALRLAGHEPQHEWKNEQTPAARTQQVSDHG